MTPSKFSYFIILLTSCSLAKPTTITNIKPLRKGIEVTAGTGFNRYWKVFISIPDSVKVGSPVDVQGWNRWRGRLD